MPLGSADTERLCLERWDHAVHGSPFSLVNAQPEVSKFVGGGALSREESDDLSRRMSQIVAFVHPENTRSLAVTRRLGMVEEGELPRPSRDQTVKILRATCSS